MHANITRFVCFQSKTAVQVPDIAKGFLDTDQEQMHKWVLAQFKHSTAEPQLCARYSVSNANTVWDYV